MKRLLIVILICLILPISALAQSYGKTGESTNFDGDVGVPSGSGFYINGVQITSGALSDVASIAMLDENETVEGNWDFKNYHTISYDTDFESLCPTLKFYRRRDGDPTYNISSGDRLGAIDFGGYSTEMRTGAIIRVVSDGTPGVNDMPGRLEFLTTPDGSATPVLRLAIDNAGNIKMGDGVWTNFIQVTAGGVLTTEGAATVTATNLVPTVEIDMGAHSVGFTLQADTGDGTTTIDWKLGNHYKFTHGNMAETFTFTAPTNPCHLTLIILEDANGAHDCTWPATVTWLGTEPTWTDGGAAKTIVVAFIYDGTTYWGQGTPWES